MAEFTLYIGNKCFSSWSLRPWVAMKHLDIPFEEGFVRHGDEARSMAGDFRALQQDPGRKDIAWRYGLGTDVTDSARHGTELANWLRVKVAPKTSRDV